MMVLHPGCPTLGASLQELSKLDQIREWDKPKLKEREGKRKSLFGAIFGLFPPATEMSAPPIRCPYIFSPWSSTVRGNAEEN